jgi:tetratricopeptide (TPR) repeat protein
MTQGDLNGAEKAARLALAKPATRALAYATLGTIRLQQKRLVESSRYLQQAIRLNSGLLGARLTLGQVYALQNKTEPARQTFQQAMKLDPQNPVPRLNLAQLEATNKNYKASLELVEPIAAQLRGSPDGLLLLLVNYLGVGRKEESRALVVDWKKLVGVPPALAIEFANPLVENGLAPEAVEVLELAKSPGPVTFELAFALGGAYLANGDLKHATEYYEQAATLNDRCALCFHQLARIAQREGIKEKALAFLIKAKAAAPDNPEILFEFGRTCLEGDLFRDAIPALEKAVQLRPDNGRYAYVLASAYVGKLRYKEALAILDRLVKQHPEDPVLNYAYGSVLYTEGTNLDGAENYLRKSISLQPNQLGAYYYLGMVMVKKGDQEQASTILHELLERYPDHLGSLEQLGTILVKQRKNDEAKQVLEKVLQLEPNSLTGHYQYGLLLGRLGKRDESTQHMEIAQRLEEVRKKESKMEFYLLTPH